MEDKKYIKTPNMELAATLLTLGIPIDGIYYSGVGETMDFYFAENVETERMINDFFAKKLRLEPRALFWSRHEIISRMKNEARTKKLNQEGH